jgi:hypothetical protein
VSKPIQQRALRIFLSRIDDWAKANLKANMLQLDEALKAEKEVMLTAGDMRDYGLKVFVVTTRNRWSLDPNRTKSAQFVVKAVRNEKDLDNALKAHTAELPPIPAGREFTKTNVDTTRYGLRDFHYIQCLESDVDTVEDALAILDNAVLGEDLLGLSDKLDLLLWKES